MRHPHAHPQTRDRARRGDFPGAPYEEGFDPRRGGYPHGEHHGGPRGPRGFGGFGGGPGFGPGGRGPGRRAGRGDIRAAVLLLLNEQPMHGYQLIQEIGERSGGQWRPSPGAIYPALNLLEDEGLVTITAESGRKLARLTEAGTTYVTENAEQLGSPFEDAASRPASPGRSLRGALEALAAAAQQVGRTGTDEQATQALAVLERSRRDLYLILAGDPVRDAPVEDA